MKVVMVLAVLLGIGVGLGLWKGMVRSEAEVPVEVGQSPTVITPSMAPSATVVPTGVALKKTLQVVLFTSQAPFGEWDDPRQQDGCEEASVLMAVKWARGETIPNATEAKRLILDTWDYQEKNFGPGRDTSAEDTAERLLKGYWGYTNYEVRKGITLKELKQEVVKGNLIIAPTNGKELGNPNFTGGGPDRHMLVIIGYDPEKTEFVTNDPGTRNGRNYVYDENVMFGAIRDYTSGDHEPIVGEEKNVIVVRGES